MLFGKSRLSDDPYLRPYLAIIERRKAMASSEAECLAALPGSLEEFACAHEYYGLHLRPEGWVFREYAPNASAICLVGDFSSWEAREEFSLRRVGDGTQWEGTWPEGAIRHGDRYHLLVRWQGGEGERIPAYARRVVQNGENGLFEAEVWNPPSPYKWKNPRWRRPGGRPLFIYEAHVGMAQERAGIGTYDEFRRLVLPRIAAAGYTVLQLMAVMEHPYYGSFGYHVGSFFACSSRFGTPDDLKALVDEAHSRGIAVIMDVVHSHAVRNERDGLSLFDGTPGLYFHSGTRGWHEAWDSRCFDYGKTATKHFLLSNLRYWLDEFHFDGFRFDGVTSMLYLHHGLGVNFTDYSMYFDYNVDEDAWVYCNLANRLVHALRPDALTIAEDMSGMPGIGSPADEGGIGFDYRMAMGVPDCWFKLVTGVRDEEWSLGYLWHELVNRRDEERSVSYVECHDQALVGGKTLLFAMMSASIYDSMHRGARNIMTDRGVALHKMIRLATIAASGGGYLNFMGNEFGHPEWIDFPREGNGYSFDHARRQWHLRDDKALFFYCLAEFDAAMLSLMSQEGVWDSRPRMLALDDGRKFLAFERGGLFFLFNFHTSEPLVDFPVVVPPGAYVGVLNTDGVLFGGRARIEEKSDYPVMSELRNSEMVQCIRVYMPPRTALVVRRAANAQIMPQNVPGAGGERKDG